MPVVFRESGLRYFFYSNEGSPRETPHVHIKGGGCDAKVLLVPDVAIVESFGFNPKEIAAILRTVTAQRDLILRTWHEHFGNGRPL
jgi:hypothetical protein